MKILWKHQGGFKYFIDGNAYKLKDDDGEIILNILFPSELKNSKYVYKFLSVKKVETFISLSLNFRNVERFDLEGGKEYLSSILGEVQEREKNDSFPKILCYFNTNAFKDVKLLN